MKNLVDIDLAGKRVGIRVDLNVPIDNGTILNSERLSAALPSILHILKHTDNLCIITHLGRPKEGNYDEQFSIKPIVEWFKKRLNRDIQLCTDFKSLPGSLCFIENIRFFDGESKNSDTLADEIAKSFDIYVMDAFATAHRKSASTYGAIKKSTLACAGILFQNEVENISSALVEGSSLSSIVGGSKVSTKLEVISLASIVQIESRRNDERPRVAGLYINRLKKNMRLQADPTVIYTIKDYYKNFDTIIRRVLYRDLKLESEFNTYRVSGLPPGPITMPDISAIDAVLNYEKNNYLFMVADPSNRGYHLFASNLSEHNRNRRAYIRWINSRGIYR